MGTPECGFSMNTGLPSESVYQDYNTPHPCRRDPRHKSGGSFNPDNVFASPRPGPRPSAAERLGRCRRDSLYKGTRRWPCVCRASSSRQVFRVLDEAEVLRHLVVQGTARGVGGMGQPVNPPATSFL